MKRIIFILLAAIFVVSCSSGNENVQKKSNEEETYVFDAIGSATPSKPEENVEEQKDIADSLKAEDKTEQAETNATEIAEEENVAQPLFFVQIGAFQTQEAAEQFVNEAKELLKNQEFTITFSDRVNLFVVQLPPFKDRKEAEKVRNRLWRYDKFKDAFIVTEE